MNYWMAIGPADNWEIGLKKKTWGLGFRYEKAWNLIEPGDIVFFYAMAPMKGLIGFGVVRDKKFEEKPFWPQEISEKQSIWPYRLAFSEIIALPAKDWQTKRAIIEKGGIVFQRSFQRVDEKRARAWKAALGKALA